jgi:DNA-binding response OmpR family regulator
MISSRKRILVIDDDPDIGAMLKMMLEFKGYKTSVTERAEKIKNLINKDHIDLIILDMLLSGVNGTDICSNLKKDSATANIPVIMISAHPNARELCEASGADSFVAKPFDMHDMLSRITALLKN